MAHLFTYGSLMFSEVFENIVRNQYEHAAGHVHHFKRTCIRNGHYPVVLPSRQAEALLGVVYFDVSVPDLRRLDAFEGDYYQRQTTTAQLRTTGQCLDVALYVLKPRYRYLATQREWSPEEFQRRHQAHFLKLYRFR